MKKWDNIFGLLKKQKDYVNNIENNSKFLRLTRDEASFQLELLEHIFVLREIFKTLKDIEELSEIKIRLLPITEDFVRGVVESDVRIPENTNLDFEN